MNFRVTDEEWEILRAVANIAECTVPKAAYEIVRRAREQEMRSEHVQTDIANRASARQSRSGDVTRLGTRRRRS